MFACKGIAEQRFTGRQANGGLFAERYLQGHSLGNQRLGLNLIFLQAHFFWSVNYEINPALLSMKIGTGRLYPDIPPLVYKNKPLRVTGADP